jgi:uncharacterized paraquat-inducible protein A
MRLLHWGPKATEDQIQQRLALCNACEFKKILPVVQVEACGVCGCPIHTKTRQAAATCPKGKW